MDIIKLKGIRLNVYRLLVALCTLSIIQGCLVVGTHGSIKGYEYPVRKDVLQKAVEKVIANNPNIQLPDTTHKGYIIDITYGKNDTMFNEHDDGYVTIIISVDNEVNDYTFRYGGNEEYWEASGQSSIFIAYAYDKNSNGGSEGSGDFPWYRPGLRKRLTRIFEQQLIEQIDKELKVKHTED